MYPLNTSFHFDTSLLQFFTSLPFTTTLNFSSVLSENNAYKNTWNAIKHAELFLMLCTFSKVNNVPEKTIMVNPDFSWKVLTSNKNVTEFVENVPEKLTNVGSFLHLLEFVDRSSVCPGIWRSKIQREFYWLEIWMTTNYKNRQELKSSLKAKHKVERIFKAQTVYFFASWGWFKFICTECIV